MPFIDIDDVDLTADFAITARAWLAERETNAGQLTQLEPTAAFEHRRREGRAQG